MMAPFSENGEQRAAKRDSLLSRIHHRIETPMVLLGIVWLLLIILDFTKGLSPFLQLVFQAIWILFIIDFIIEFVIAPRKIAYLKHNWLTALSLVVPALRVFRVFRAAMLLRAANVGRGARLVSVVGSVNRGMRALGQSLSKRGFQYVMLLTLIVTFAGAAGMYSFEKGNTKVLSDYGSALWWTAMIMTTMGSGEWPDTSEGRILCLLLALYSFTIFGYITATLASFFVGQDKNEGFNIREKDTTTDSLREQMTRLSKQLENLEKKGEKP